MSRVVSETCLNDLERLALEVTGVQFASSSRRRAEVAFSRLMDERGDDDCERLIAAMGRGDEGAGLIERIVGEATTKETYLFRDPAQFDALREEVLPAVAAHARKTGGTLRVWSAGCATGEETYSVAMLLAEMPVPKWMVVGTDLSRTAVERARARYHQRMRLAPDAEQYRPLLERWSELTSEGLRFAEKIRSHVRFATHNLVRDQAYTGQHIILCRNVMIYLPPTTQHELLQRLWGALLPGGRLLLGEAELLHLLKHDFERLPIERAVIYGKPAVTGGMA